jgi:hypothetical protein
MQAVLLDYPYCTQSFLYKEFASYNCGLFNITCLS